MEQALIEHLQRRAPRGGLWWSKSLFLHCMGIRGSRSLFEQYFLKYIAYGFCGLDSGVS